MIEKMTKYSFILLSGDKQQFLQDLQGLGVMDISRSEKPVDDHSAELLGKIDAKKQEIRDINRGEDAHLSKLLSGLDALRKEEAEAEVWGNYDPAALATFNPHFYSTAAKKYNNSWEESYAIQKVLEEGGKVWFVLLGDNSGFPLKEMEAPARNLSVIKTDLEEAEKEVNSYRKVLESCKENIPALEEELGGLTAELNLYLAGETGEKAAENSLVIYEGFAPTENTESIKPALDEMAVYYFAEDACVEDRPPIKLRNNRFVKMFEVLTDMYGRPAYNGFDPTPFIAIFFLLFFAMCIGDAGYGLILVIVGLLLRKVKSFSNLAPLVVSLGIGTVVVGFFFHTFFSIDFSNAAWLQDGLKKIMVPATVAGYDGTMVLALAVGIVHLLLAMIVKTIYATKNKGFLNSLSTWGWTVFWVGLAVVLLFSLAGVIEKTATKTIIIILGIVCAIGIFPLNNIHRNPLINIGSGLWDTYNMATGILGDVLSYLRLYALGLAGAMLGFAFNDLAAMALGDGGWRWIPFVLIVVIGHTLNIAMAALGAFVHPLRLNFLEFFKNSDYSADGVKYKPLKK